MQPCMLRIVFGARRGENELKKSYNKTWWEERAEAVSMSAASVWPEFIPTLPVPAAM